jgi:DNA-binding PadR family transcriptional regulator
MGTGVIYKMLRKFTKDRLVRVTEVKSPEGPRRKHYQLTPLGRETLLQMNAYWDSIRNQAEAMAAYR